MRADAKAQLLSNSTQEPDRDFDDTIESGRRQGGNLSLDQLLTRSEQFPGTRVAREVERTAGEIRLCQLGSKRISVRIAGDLAQHVVAAPGGSKNDRGAKLGL